MKPDAKSEAIRLNLGLLTPQEREAQKRAEAARKDKALRAAALGTPLLAEEP